MLNCVASKAVIVIHIYPHYKEPRLESHTTLGFIK